MFWCVLLVPWCCRICGICQPAQSGAQEVCEERLWVYTDGCRWGTYKHTHGSRQTHTVLLTGCYLSTQESLVLENQPWSTASSWLTSTQSAIYLEQQVKHTHTGLLRSSLTLQDILSETEMVPSSHEKSLCRWTSFWPEMYVNTSKAAITLDNEISSNILNAVFLWVLKWSWKL